MSSSSYRKAPSGFTTDQWEEFMREGFLTIENALTEDEIDYYVDAIDRCCANDSTWEPGAFYGPTNAVEKDPVLAGLIDHPRHVGYFYDLYGELLKLHLSQICLRPTGGTHSKWHQDGPRTLPYRVFAPTLPMQVKISYWLTDLPRPKMGNFVYMPGSHNTDRFDAYNTHESVPGEKITCPPRGTITLMHCNLWHRVEPNESDVLRKNIFLAYCPSWICEADRHQSSPQWLETLNREQRIIMRSYDYGYHRTKPQASEFPLFLDRETGRQTDSDDFPDLPMRLRKRLTMHEKLNLMETA